ncbi:MAG: hypothetical protein VW270_17380 [Candidatus Poseidoniales archaeon]
MDNDHDDSEEFVEELDDADHPSADEGGDVQEELLNQEQSDTVEGNQDDANDSEENAPSHQSQPQIPLPSQDDVHQTDEEDATPSTKIVAMSKKSIALLLAAMVIFSFLAVVLANGMDDRSSERDSRDDADPVDLEFVPTVDMLPDCDDHKDEGAILVLETATIFTCTDDGWSSTPLLPSTNSSVGNNTSAQELQPSIVDTEDIESGPECANGGIRILVGVDENSDGILQSHEVASSSILCNGEDGADGSDGSNGLDGSDGANGTDGADGVNGTDGAQPSDFLAQVSDEPSGVNCEFGGSKVEYGFDENSNQILDGDEIQSTTYICDDDEGGNSNSPLYLTKVSPVPFEECNAGGQKIEQGYDDGGLNATAMNGVLEDDEIDSTTVYCSTYDVEIPIEVNPSGPSFAQSFSSHGSTLYFSATDGNSGKELWGYDTDNESYWQVIDLNPGAGGSSPSSIVVIGDNIFFASDGNDSRSELWRFDTSTGTANKPADYSGTGHSYPNHLTAVGELLFFSQESGDQGNELYIINTSSMDVWFFDLEITPVEGSNPIGFTHIGDEVFFTAATLSEGRELWKYDIQNNSTSMVFELNSDSSDGISGEIFQYGEDLIFQGNNGVTDAVFRYNTSLNQTQQIQSIYSSLSSVSWLHVYQNHLFFIANDGVHGLENWVTNLDNDTTWMMADIAEGAAHSDSRYKIGHEGKLFFRAEDGITGEELWVYDIVTNQTIQLKNINQNGASSPREFVLHAGEIYFFASTGLGVTEMMKVSSSIEISIDS